MTTAERDPKVVIDGITKSYETEQGMLGVLDDIRFEVAEGEFICLLGPSGCGKSTLLNIIAGFESSQSGEIRIDGEVVAGPDPRRVFVFQELGIFPWMTVWDNIAIGLASQPFEERHRVAMRAIELVGLVGFEKAYPHELSGGMKQRVEVARALAVDPDVIYMDEPFGALDSLTRLRMRAEIIRIWSQEQNTILFVTHDIEESVQLADRIVVFTDRPAGVKTILTVDLPHPRNIGSPDYLAVRNEVVAAMGGQQEV